MSKVWAHAWVDYLFYDTDLFYSIIRNKNYELPDPPVDYVFKSSSADHMININVYHAFIIKSFHTPNPMSDVYGCFLSERDNRILRMTIEDTITDLQLQLVDRQSKKMILKILKDPKNWKSWLQLFDDENIYEETLNTEDRRESAGQTPYEISPNMSGLIKRCDIEEREIHHNKIFEKFKNFKEKNSTMEENFAMKPSASEYNELDMFDRSKQQSVPKRFQSVVPRIDIEMSDIDTHFYSPRINILEEDNTKEHKRVESDRRHRHDLREYPLSSRTKK